MRGFVHIAVNIDNKYFYRVPNFWDGTRDLSRYQKHPVKCLLKNYWQGVKIFRLPENSTQENSTQENSTQENSTQENSTQKTQHTKTQHRKLNRF